MSRWTFWRSAKAEPPVTTASVPDGYTKVYLTLDENGCLFGSHETVQEARDVVAYWKDRGTTMYIREGYSS